MITEDYCSFEVAKLLKEKGFNTDYPKRDCTQYACTLQMAMKWLRKIHNIFIEINTSIDLNGKYHFSYTILDKKCKYIRKGYTDFDWDYKEAADVAIKYSLENLI